jgi:hypothetical protein
MKLSTKFLIIIISIILTIFNIILVSNALYLLFQPIENNYYYNGPLYAKYNPDGTENVLGNKIAVDLNFSTKHIYNTLYYNGDVVIEGKEYKIEGKFRKARSLLAKIYDYFFDMDTMIGRLRKPYGDIYELNIIDFDGYDRVYISYFINGKYVILIIRKDNICYGWYEK